MRRLGPNVRSMQFVIFLCLMMLTALVYNSRVVLAQNGSDGRARAAAKRILVLCSYGYSLPAYQKLNPAFLTVMVDAGMSSNDLFFEYLDLLRLKNSEYRQALADMLRHKYAQTAMDLIVTLHAPAMSFMLNEAKDIFPDVPVVSWNVPEAFKTEDTQSRVIRLSVGLDLRGTLQRALELFPQTTRVVFIDGVSQIDQYLAAEAKNAFADWENKLQFEYTANYSVEEVLGRVAHLPPRSIVIYGNIFKDKTGRTFIPRDVGQMVAGTANAPVFCLYDTLLGLGVVGGSLVSFAADGVWVAKLALDVLNGKIGHTEKTTTMTGKPVPMFDWQQIQRWGGRMGSLPEGSIFINRPNSFWQRYSWYIIGISGLLLGQMLLVSALLFQKARRGRAEAELKLINQTLERRVAERTAKLQESEAKYRNLFANMAEEVHFWQVVRDEAGQIKTWRLEDANPSALKTWGRSTADEIRGKSTDEILGDGATEQFLPIVRKIMTEGVPHSFEDYFPNLDKYFRFTSVPLGDYFITTGADITVIKKTEERLRQVLAKAEEGDRLLTALMEYVPEGILMVDAALNLTRVSRYCQQVLGGPPQGVSAADAAVLRKVWHADGQTPMAYEELPLVRAVQRGEVVKDIEIVQVGADGGSLPLLGTAGPIRDAAGQITGGIVAWRDISVRKRAEKELQQLSQFPEENTNPVLRCNPEGVVLYANASARRWLATLGWNPGRPLPASLRTAVSEACGQDRAIETEITNPAERTFNICAVQPPGEDYINLYGIDLTERKQAEKALRESEERLRASLKEKEVLLQEIHHRVKNNMQVISSLVALQAETIQDAALRTVLMDVTHRVRSMAMVHEKLYQSADLARVEFSEYARSLLSYLWRAHGFAATGVQLVLDLQPMSLSVNAAVPCGLILNELVSNALKHAFCNRTDGQVTVSLRNGTQGRVYLFVRDNGTGLPAGFDWRQSRSLGLRLVQMLAGQLHAAVEVTSVGGVEFTITFGGPEK